jgi:hypothetical protein
MKFGKRLEKQMYRKWTDAYVNYKQLKNLIKTHPQDFIDELAKQLANVNTFYDTNAAYFTGVLSDLTMSVQQQVALDRQIFAEFWKELNHFRTYVMLNYMAVIKIVKKWNKKAGDGCAALDAFTILHLQSFYHSRCFAHLLVRAEMLALCCMSPSSAARSDWTCPVCSDILCNPVVLDCAHRFCWSCITKALETSDCCPVCRKRLVLEEGDVRGDIPLENFLNDHCPPLTRETLPTPIDDTSQSSDASVVSKRVSLLLDSRLQRSDFPPTTTVTTFNGTHQHHSLTMKKKILIIGIDSLPTNALLLGPTNNIKRLLLSGRHSLVKVGVPGTMPTWACVLKGER